MSQCHHDIGVRQDHNQICISGAFSPVLPPISFISFPSSTSHSLSFHRLKAEAQIQLRGLESAVASQRGKTTLAATSHVPWALNTPKCVCGRGSERGSCQSNYQSLRDFMLRPRKIFWARADVRRFCSVR